jgi:hypothetical protein
MSANAQTSLQRWQSGVLSRHMLSLTRTEKILKPLDLSSPTFGLLGSFKCYHFTLYFIKKNLFANLRGDVGAAYVDRLLFPQVKRYTDG